MKFLEALFGRSSALSRSLPLPAAATSPSNEQLIRDYAGVMERSPPMPAKIEDASTLPHRKELILDAIFMELEKPHPQQTIDFLKVAATSIVQFQYNVGSEPLYQLGMDISKLSRTNDLKRLREEAIRVSEAAERTKDRYNEFDRMVQDDVAFVSKKIAAADLKRRARAGT